MQSLCVTFAKKDTKVTGSDQSVTGVTVQRSVISSLNQSRFSAMPTGTLKPRNSPAPSHRGSLGNLLPVTQTELGARLVCARCSHGWGGTGESYGWDALPNVHLRLARSRLRNCSLVSMTAIGNHRLRDKQFKICAHTFVHP